MSNTEFSTAMPSSSRVALESDTEFRLFSKQQCASVFQRLLQSVTGTGEADISICTWWNSELRWARNRLNVLSNRRDIQLMVYRSIGGRYGMAFTNQVDDASLAAAMRESERTAREGTGVTFGDWYPDAPQLDVPTPPIWSDATLASPIEARSKLVQLLVDRAEARGMLSAGYLEIRGTSTMRLVLDDRTIAQWKGRPATEVVTEIERQTVYAAYTQAQCSMTVRHPKGTGSGWSGASSFDWGRIDTSALAEQALDKSLQSIDPVRIEPGRYTVILEPQAVADLVDFLAGGAAVRDGGDPFERVAVERGAGPFALGLDPQLGLIRSKLGLRVMDPRITIDHDPMDPQLGVPPVPGLAPITWIDKGVLQTLSYAREYSVIALNQASPALPRPGYRMSGGTTSVREMIATTQRGLLVTRFSNLRMLDLGSLLMTGVTRDGLWLIENGKITKAVKNMRITESPLFVLNSVEQMGEPVPVFRPVRNPFDSQLTPAVVPPIKARDFSFTSLIDVV